MKQLIFLLSLVILFHFSSYSQKIIKIACIGNSITEGSGLACQSKSAYPVILDSILGKNYEVLNCGQSAATVQKKGNLPYWNCNEFSNVFVYKPDIITIKLGTNDTKAQNWNPERFALDYQSLIDTLKSMKSKPRIYLCIPVPVYKTNWGITDSVLVNGVIPIINKIGETNKIKIIDLYNPLLGFPQYFPDGVHPNEEGEKKIAGLIAKEIIK